MYFDIHSHILPGVDDGATDMQNSVELLKTAKDNGISAIVATPHFYPTEYSLNEFLSTGKNAFELLNEEIKGLDLPKVYFGSEVLYFRGLGDADSLHVLTLNNSKYILIELTGKDINKYLFEDLIRLKNQGYIPIIAHIERYTNSKGFRKLFKFVKTNNIMVQINTISLSSAKNLRFLKKVLRSEIFCVVASDTHSLESRPPLFKSALEIVKEKLGNKCYELLIKNSQKLYNKIIGEDIE